MRTASSLPPVHPFPAAVSQGATRSEAQANIREAIELYLQSIRKHGDPIPPGIEEEVIQVAG
jgi:predicted RNase H-like HicB family nuclease